MSHSMVNQLNSDEGSSVSRRKSSWSNFLGKGEEDSPVGMAHPQIKRLTLPSQQAVSRYQYNIEDYLPKPHKTATYASVDLGELEDDLSPPFVLTARFPEADMQLKHKKPSKEESELQEEWKAQKAEIERLKEAVEKIEKGKPKANKVLGWSQRIELKIMPVEKQQPPREARSTQTDELPEDKILRPSVQLLQEGATTRQHPKTTRESTTSPFGSEQVETVYRNNARLLEKDTNIPLLPIRETARQPLKRIRKEYTELYAIRTDQITDTVMALLRYQND